MNYWIMQHRFVTRRTQFSSCDECRRLRVRCDALNGSYDRSSSCTRCSKRHRQCTFEWMNGLKQRNRPELRSHHHLRHRSGPSVTSLPSSPVDMEPPCAPSPGISIYQQQTISGRTPTGPRAASGGAANAATRPPWDGISLVDAQWLQKIYLAGFETIFGSWMSRYGCPFLSENRLGDVHTSIYDVCSRLDQWMREMPHSDSEIPRNGTAIAQDRLADDSLRSSIAAFSARWLPIVSMNPQPELHYQSMIHALWRHARRDMLRVINRPSYRSMLTLFLFALTPIPAGISQEEELDGVSGQACIHAGLQQIQMLRARQRSLQFNGTNVSQPVKAKVISTIPDTIGATDFLDAENIAYWAALTFDTSASLTLNCRSLLSSGLFGFEAELPWRLARASATSFQTDMQNWPAHWAYDMTEERANQIIASASAWKLLTWKLTALVKEALRDGHDGPEVSRAFTLVVEAIQQFNTIFRGPLESCQLRMPFLGQQAKFRWYSLMLHYHLSILLLVNVVEATDRLDLLDDFEGACSVAVNAVVNALVFSLQNTITLSVKIESGSPGTASVKETSATVPLISLDPYQHHIVVAVQLVQRAIDRDLALGKLSQPDHAGLCSTLEKALDHLPQSSKSVKAARDAFRSKGSEVSIGRYPNPYSVLQGQYVE